MIFASPISTRKQGQSKVQLFVGGKEVIKFPLG